MKKLLVIGLLVLFMISATMPPQLPSSFYGWITGGAVPGMPVEAYVNGVRLAYTNVIVYLGDPVYSLNVAGANQGDVVKFKINGVVSGSGIIHIGTNVRLDLVYIAPVVKPAPVQISPIPMPVCLKCNRWLK